MGDTWIERLEVAGGILSAMLVVLLPIEVWQRWRRGQLSRPVVLEMLACASPLVPTVVTAGIVTTFIATIFVAASKLALWSIPTNGWTAVGAVVVVDFLYYWDHRAAHRLRPYWAIAHSVHHSSPQFDQTVGLRISFVDGFLSPWFYLPAVLIGFHPLLIGAAFAVVLGYQQWIHTETIGKLPWLDRWFNTPSNHRVHHGSQERCLDRNYGGILILWDRLFGTYAAETEPVVYGLTEPIGTSHPWAVHTVELTRWLRDLREARGPRECVRRFMLMP